MGFAQGIQAGQAIARQWDPYATSKGDPYDVMRSLSSSRKRGGARGVQMGAANMALKERAMALQERQQKMAEEQFEINRHRQATQDRQSQLTAMEARPGQIESEYQQEIQGIDRTAGQQEAMRGQSVDKQRDSDFKTAQWGLATGNTDAITSYFDKYGNPDSKIDSMEFGPEGKDVIVKFSGQDKDAYFSKKDFMRKFMIFASPQTEKSLEKMGEQEAQKRERKPGRNPYRVTVAQAGKEYDNQFTDAMGNPKKDAPDKESWTKDYVTRHEEMGAGDAIESRKREISRQRYKTGKTVVSYSDGSRDILGADGSVEFSEGGTPKQGAIPSSKEKGQIVRGKIEQPSKEKAAPKEASRGAKASKEASVSTENSITYTDKSGNKIRVSIDEATGKIVKKKVKKDDDSDSDSDSDSKSTSKSSSSD